MADVKAKVEALLFASGEPLSVTQLHDVLPESSAAEIKKAVQALKQECDTSERAFTVEEIAGGYQLLTRPEHQETIEKLKKRHSEERLSVAALETLAIIAYKQPVKRVDVEAIRGVQSGELIRALMEKGLVRIVGRAEVPGSPLLYGTTKKFLDLFQLSSLQNLPQPEELKA